MRPNHYVDIAVTGGGVLGKPVLCGAIVHILHGAFRLLPPHRYALALPRPLFSQLRVFAASRDDLDELVAAIADHPRIRDQARLAYPRQVPADFAGPWLEFRRYRIPTRKQDRDGTGLLRVRRIRAADERRLPYLMLQSKSNGQHFGLYIETIAHAADPAGGEPCLPDSYGLSVGSRAFAVPAL